MDAPEALDGCLLDLQADVAAIRRRLAVDAREQAREDKKQLALVKLAAQLREKLDAAASTGDLKVDELKAVVEQMVKVVAETGTPFGCADPERQWALMEHLKERLGSLGSSLGDGSATCCADRVAAAVKSVAAAIKQIDALAKCDGWAFKIPGADSQLESTGPGDAPIDEYLFDARGALERLVKWLPLRPKRTCKAGDRSDVPSFDFNKIAGGAGMSVNDVKLKMATQGGRDEIRQKLGATSDEYKQLTAADELRVEETACVVSEQIHSLLHKRNLHPRMIGVLVPAVNFTRGGGDDGQTGTAASAHVDLTSRRLPLLGPLGLAWVGRVGYRQVHHLVAPAAGEDDEPLSNERIASDTAAQFDSAFVWDIGGKLGVLLGSAGELSVAGRIGQSHFGGDAQVKKGKDGAPATLVVPTDKSGAGVWYREVSARFVAFHERNDHQVVAYELGVLRPMASIEWGLRWDDQLRPPTFESETDPEARALLLQTVTDRFGDHPRRRQFLRLSLQGVPVAGLDSELFALSFAVEHEWHGWAKPGIAAGTKIYLQGTLNLANALKGL